MELVLFQPEEFTMGSPNSNRGQAQQGTVNVTLIERSTSRKRKLRKLSGKQSWGRCPEREFQHTRGRRTYPATYISWDDAQAYCKKLSQKENRKYRLPTESGVGNRMPRWHRSAFSYGDNGGTSTRRLRMVSDNTSGANEFYADEVLRRIRILSGCSTCTAMSRNGARIRTVMTCLEAWIRGDWTETRLVLFAAEIGFQIVLNAGRPSS